MPGTQVRQDRAPVVSGTTTTYDVSAVCTLQGTLPDSRIFLMRIVQPSDPKNDTFERVCEVTDFTTYSASRESAISDATFLYRIQTFTKSYADIVTANAAWKELQDRVNKLVVDYDAYITEFLTGASGAITTFPTVNEGEKAELIAVYDASAGAVATAEDARDTESAMCEVKRSSLRTAQERLVEAQADLATLSPVVGAVAALLPTYSTATVQISTLTNTIQAINSASSATTTEKAYIDAQLAQLRATATGLNTANLSLTANVQVPLGSLQASLQTRVTSLTAEVNSLQLEVNACALEMAELQAAVDSARNAQNQALANVRAVCPDFVPA